MREKIIKLISFFILNKYKRKEFRKKFNYRNLKRREIIKFYKNTHDEEIKEILNYMEKLNDLDVYNYKDMDNYYKQLKVQSFYDEKNKLYYVYHQNKKMYLNSNFFTKEKAEEYYKGLLKEQYITSPHRYVTDDFNLKNSKCLVDCGGAEGIFTLENIDLIDKAYIFECDEKWIEALELTFKEYKDKVIIIKKFVSDTNNEEQITLDKFQEEITEKIDFINLI